MRHEVDPAFPGPERFKGVVRITLKDGRVIEGVQEHNRGSARNPMRTEDLLAKFEANAAARLTPVQAARVVDAVMALETADDAGRLVALTAGT